MIALRPDKTVPARLLGKIQQAINGEIPVDSLTEFAKDSLLGEILMTGLGAGQRNPAVSAFEEAGALAVQKMERYLTTLGTIAVISPLLGLLGTVVGMIKVLSSVGQAGQLDSGLFVSGISEALATTALGLIVAIPALVCHRHFVRRVDEFTLTMEAAAERVKTILYRKDNSGRSSDTP